MLIPILFSTLAALPSTTQEPAAVWRSYDLRAIAPAGRNSTRVERLLPFLDPGSEVNAEETHADSLRDGLQHLLTEVFLSELEQPDRGMFTQEEGILFVRVPELVHQKIAELLAQLARALRGETEIDVLYASVPHGDAGLLPQAGLIGATEVNALASRLQGGSGRSFTRATLRVPAQSEGWFAAARNIDALVDYDVEIAQGAHVADPKTMDLCTGLRLGVRTSGDEAGTWIACIARSAELTAAPGQRQVRIPGRLMGVEGVQRRTSTPTGVTTTTDGQLSGGLALESDGDYQISQIAAACAAWSVESYVPAGQALVLRSRVSVEDALTEGVLVLAPRAHAAPRASIALADGSRLVVRGTAPWSTPRAQRNGDLPSTRTFGQGFVTQLESAQGLEIELHDMPAPEELTSYELQDGDESSIVAGVQMLWQRGSNTVLPQVARPAPRMASIELVLTRGEKREAHARATCVVRAGGSGLVVLGREALEVHDYAVEVATAASICDPMASLAFQGLVAEVEPQVAPDGSFTVLVRTRARLHRAPRANKTLAPNSPSTLDFADADLLASEELLRADANGAIDARVGTALGGGLGVEVRAKLLP
ncbi:MAG: hypothetical protein FJ299_05120 [Planctomycetes bacterium]|nr:hypothetical protein [Planctomycetota bacterium]